MLVLAAGAALAPQSANSSAQVGNKIYAHKLAVALGKEPARGKEMPLSSGVLQTLMEKTGVIDQRSAKWAQTAQGRAVSTARTRHSLSDNKTEGCQNVFHGHGQTNTRVNQDCSFRRQAEEMIAINPLDEKNIIAGQNDSRIGFNHCGYDWSFDGGKNWGDQLPPFYQFVQLDNHTADACSDPTGAWDSRGNAYVGGVLFDIASGANSVLVEKSNAGNGGAFYHSPAPGAFQEYVDNPPGVVANDDGNDFANDKELLTADSHASSPKRDNVYMTWTRFNAAGHSPIYFSQSTDGAATWSAPLEISGSNAAICTRPRMWVLARMTRARIRSLARRVDLRRLRQREHPRRRHRADAVREVPGVGGLLERGELDGSGQDRHAVQYLAGWAQRSHRMRWRPQLSAAERLPDGDRDGRNGLG